MRRRLRESSHVSNILNVRRLVSQDDARGVDVLFFVMIRSARKVRWERRIGGASPDRRPRSGAKNLLLSLKAGDGLCR